MAKSLAKINEQIARLQKQADAIQSSVITRIKREIAQHGLTVEHLFGSSAVTAAEKRPAKSIAGSASAAKKAAANKPAKFVDGQGNSWHGVGKRPQWIHDALAAGASLDQFLVAAGQSAPKPEISRAPAPTKSKPARKVAAKKVAAKKTAKPRVITKPTAKTKVTSAPKALRAVKKAPVKKAKASAPAVAAQTQA